MPQDGAPTSTPKANGVHRPFPPDPDRSRSPVTIRPLVLTLACMWGLRVRVTPDGRHSGLLRDGRGERGGARVAQLRPAAGVGVQRAGHLRELGNPVGGDDVSVCKVKQKHSLVCVFDPVALARSWAYSVNTSVSCTRV